MNRSCQRKRGAVITTISPTRSCREGRKKKDKRLVQRPRNTRAHFGSFVAVNAIVVALLWRQSNMVFRLTCTHVNEDSVSVNGGEQLGTSLFATFLYHSCFPNALVCEFTKRTNPPTVHVVGHLHRDLLITCKVLCSPRLPMFFTITTRATSLAVFWGKYYRTNHDHDAPRPGSFIVKKFHYLRDTTVP